MFKSIRKAVSSASRREVSAKLRRAVTPRVESLGDRVLMAANLVSFQPVSNGLAIMGSQLDDRIDVSYTSSTKVLSVTATNTLGTTTEKFTVSNPATFDLGIFGNNGNDTININGTLKATVRGGWGNDTINGGDGADSLYGDEGDDVMSGGRGDDLMDGGNGNDTIGAQWEPVWWSVSPEDGNDTILGGAGNDVLGGGAGNDVLWGGDGNDILRGDDGNDQLYGEAGDDNMGAVVQLNTTNIRRNEKGDDQLQGGSGIDTMRGGDGDDYLSGGAGNDVMGAAFQSGKYVGDDGDDKFHGDEGNDDIGGGRGNDQIWGDAGDDLLSGGDGDDLYQFRTSTATGNDTVSERAGNGKDTLDFSFGALGLKLNMNAGRQQVLPNLSLDLQGGEFENVVGTNGNDWIFGNNLDNVIKGQGGDDEIYGNGGNDSIRGGDGHDRISGGAGNDSIVGDGGNDRIVGNEGDDLLFGGSGNDVIGATVVQYTDTYGYAYNSWQNDIDRYGCTAEEEAGDDNLDGGDGDDILGGGEGSDYLLGRTGDDRLAGGSGDDYLFGGDDKDELYGEGGVDYFSGGEGKDYIDCYDEVKESVYTGGGLDDTYEDAHARYSGWDYSKDDDIYYSADEYAAQVADVFYQIFLAFLQVNG